MEFMDQDMFSIFLLQNQSKDGTRINNPRKPHRKIQWAFCITRDRFIFEIKTLKGSTLIAINFISKMTKIVGVANID